jgi:hypothetical protein
MTVFEIPENISHGRNYPAEYQTRLSGGASGFNVERGVNAVNHGEFERAVTLLVQQAGISDEGSTRCLALALQRCRRGGKTFMLHAVASQLSAHFELQQQQQTHVLLITMNIPSSYDPTSENAHTAITSRIAWELSGRKLSFRRFKAKYSDFGEVDEWLMSNHVILIVDELNVIHHDAVKYGDMCSLLDEFVGNPGCALMYSTHQRGTADLLRGRRPGTAHDLSLSKRKHVFLSIPRIQSQACLHGMLKNHRSEQPSFWCAVL